MPLPRGLSLEEQPHVPEIPEGLPSALREARPDIRAPSNDRYRGGAAGFLEVLTTQQQYLNSELQLAEAQSAELRDYVQLYRALGGGWGT
jgi:multidrug efflux system outer membrane protein